MIGKYVWFLTPTQMSNFLSFLDSYDPTLSAIAESAFTDDTAGSGYWVLELTAENDDIWGVALNDFDEFDLEQGNDYGFDFWTASNLPGSLWP